MKAAMLAAVAAVLTANAGNSMPGAGSVTHVHQENIAFNPKNVTILIGEAVNWDNHDLVTHTVTADDGSFDSGDMGNGATYERTFAVAGTFSYFCTYHAQSGMVGKVLVSDPTASPDLVIAELAFSDTLPGLEKVINVTVRNLGLKVAGTSHATASYHHGGELHQIAEVAFPELGPGERITRQVPWNTLGKLGDFAITALADSQDEVVEADEDNNAADAQTSVLVSGVPGIDVLAILP